MTTMTKQEVLSLSEHGFAKAARKIDPTTVLYAADVRRLRQSATRGARALDKAEPNWFSQGHIALSRFDISDCDVCVLGQVFTKKTAEAAEQAEHPWDVTSGWDAGKVLVFGSTSVCDEDIMEHGFDSVDVLDNKDGFDGHHVNVMSYAVLQDQWEHEIRARRAARV